MCEYANEEWRPVKDYPYYEVSNTGKLRSIDRTIVADDGRVYNRKGREISLKPNKAGYSIAGLVSDGKKRTTVQIHRLVAEAFVDNPNGYPNVAHRNGLRNDNRASNLEWCSYSETCAHRNKYDKKVAEYHRDSSAPCLPDEEWRDIEGYEDYQVSSLGRVFSKKTSRILKQGHHTGGYMKVCLCKDGAPTSQFVHRLVAEAFIPRVEGCEQINHVSENKEDNSVRNLEWCDQAYNNVFGTGPERRAAKWDPSKAYQMRQKPVLQYDLDGNLINRWDSQAEACRELGLDANTVSRACNRRDVGQCVHGIAYGYRWDFEGVEYDA